MVSTRTWAREERAREIDAATPALIGRRITPAPSQTRTCARCGRYTTFVLDDPAGGWYVCNECGRYA